MTSGIYKIQHISSGKFYIGSSKNIEARWKAHSFELSNNKHGNLKLQNAWNKYGASSFLFIVLEFVEDLDLLLVKEQQYIDSLKPFYNIALVVTSCMKGRNQTEAAKLKVSVANKGRIVSEATRAKISEANKGRKMSDAALENMRKAQKGRIVSEESKRKMSETRKGKKLNLSDEQRLAISNRFKGNTYTKGSKLSEEHKAKIKPVFTEETKAIMRQKLKGNTRRADAAKNERK